VSQPAEETTALFANHLQQVAEQWASSLAFAGIDAAIVTAGEPVNYFLDDQAPPQKLNPHFLQWCPEPGAIGSALLIRPGKTPQLYFLQPNDYWHQPPELPVWAVAFEVRTFAESGELLEAVRQSALTAGNHLALIGDSGQAALKLPDEDVNPQTLLDHLHFARGKKTAFELEAMGEATAKAVRGHLAARDAFYAGASEFQINLAYLGACGQLPAELPYQNIVALNEHAGVLHYQHYDSAPPARRHSFLIDAGGSQHGYASDITRTYAAESESLFAELVERLDAAQLALIETMTAGTPYLNLHEDMHRRLAGILTETQLITCSAEQAFECGLTETFLPHGLGHLIGLQTHDVGGQQVGPEGGLAPPPENYPALRLTRTLEEHMPVTIEPGLYFIPQLLDAASSGPSGKHLNRALIESLLPCGGIRIEDNVYLDDGKLVNVTRDAFAANG
jgi:Xaa-Pro dipeptidase